VLNSLNPTSHADKEFQVCKNTVGETPANLDHRLASSKPVVTGIIHIAFDDQSLMTPGCFVFQTFAMTSSLKSISPFELNLVHHRDRDRYLHQNYKSVVDFISLLGLERFIVLMKVCPKIHHSLLGLERFIVLMKVCPKIHHSLLGLERLANKSARTGLGR